MNDGSLNNQIAGTIFSLFRVMKDEMDYHSDSSQLTVLQAQALIYLQKKKKVSMSEIASNFKISLPTATSLSDKLVNAGLIERQSDKSDRRIVYLIITDKGTKLLAEAMIQRGKKIKKILSLLSTEEKQQLLKIMKKLVVTIQKENEK